MKTFEKSFVTKKMEYFNSKDFTFYKYICNMYTFADI